MNASDNRFFRTIFPIRGDIAVKSIFGIWAAYFLVLTVRSLFVSIPYPEAVFVQRMLVTIVCMVMSWILYLLLITFRRLRMGHRVLILVTVSVPLSNVAAIADTMLFNHQVPLFDFSYLTDSRWHGSFPWERTLDEAFTRYFIIAGAGALFLALIYSEEVNEYAERNAALERGRQEAEIRALRYQINPHFIFNALNSVSSLIIDKENEKAEQLLEKFSDFMRSALVDKPEPMASLADEIAMQTRYLEIERIRFPNRFSYSVDIDPRIADVMVPSLIVQPLIENAVKYGVARSRTKVTILIRAWWADDKINVLVENDGPADAGQENDGTYVGHENIDRRLKTQYGKEAGLLVEASKKEGYAVKIIIPMDENL